jgi:hypothetical protein
MIRCAHANGGDADICKLTDEDTSSPCQSSGPARESPFEPQIVASTTSYTNSTRCSSPSDDLCEGARKESNTASPDHSRSGPVTPSHLHNATPVVQRLSHLTSTVAAADVQAPAIASDDDESDDADPAIPVVHVGEHVSNACGLGELHRPSGVAGSCNSTNDINMTRGAHNANESSFEEIEAAGNHAPVPLGDPCNGHADRACAEVGNECDDLPLHWAPHCVPPWLELDGSCAEEDYSVAVNRLPQQTAHLDAPQDGAQSRWNCCGGELGSNLQEAPEERCSSGDCPWDETPCSMLMDGLAIINASPEVSSRAAYQQACGSHHTMQDCTRSPVEEPRVHIEAATRHHAEATACRESDNFASCACTLIPSAADKNIAVRQCTLVCFHLWHASRIHAQQPSAERTCGVEYSGGTASHFLPGECGKLASAAEVRQVPSKHLPRVPGDGTGAMNIGSLDGWLPVEGSSRSYECTVGTGGKDASRVLPADVTCRASETNSLYPDISGIQDLPLLNLLCQEKRLLGENMEWTDGEMSLLSSWHNVSMDSR